MQTWRKLGRILSGPTHVAYPVAEVLDSKTIRIYFSPRGPQNRSSIHSFEFDVTSRKPISEISAPLLTPGGRGSFSEDGASMCCLLQTQKDKYIYYLGWNIGVTVPFRNSIGVARYNSSMGKWENVFDGPILDRSPVDPYTISYPFVLEENGKFRMWYGSHKAWGTERNEMLHHLKHAESLDALHWKPDGRVIIECDEVEYAFSRPHVVKENGIYKMWYSFRGSEYRTGYAESPDGLQWERKDHLVQFVGESEAWDFEAQNYPNVFDLGGNRYMLYNGNAYGKTGFGLAVLESL